MSKYRDRTGDVVVMDGQEPPPPPRPCSWCGTTTAHATLANYGARCFACYESYCAKGVKGGSVGFTDDRRDTPGQLAMRRRGHAGASNVLKGPDPDEASSQDRDAAKRETQRRYDAYVERDA